MADRESRRFIGYPVDHVLAVLDDPADGARAAAEITSGGVPTRDVTILRGIEGAERLDGTGASHGRRTRMRRVIDFTLADQLVDMAWYEQAVRDGKAVLMVRVRNQATRTLVLGSLRAHGGHFINHYGRFATEEIERWRGPEPDLPSVLKR